MTDRQLRDLCALVIEADQPDIPDSGVLHNPAMRRLMARLSYQQGFFRYDEYGDVMRTLALLVEHDPAVHGLPTAQDWEAELGVPLPDYLAIVFALYVGANMRRGRFTTADLAHHAEVGAFGGHDAATVEKLIATHLATDLPALHEKARTEDADESGPGRQMWLTNPLLATPMISDSDGWRAPISPYLLHKITPLGLYFTGLTHFGDDFPRALGDSFELVVGRHLALLTACGAVVHPEIAYGRKGSKKTVDYLIVFPELVLLVESKSMRSTAEARLGDEDGLALLTTRVQKARNQIDTTADLIADRIPELEAIPADRPIRGLVVTLEPIPLVDTYLFTDLIGPNTVQSATVCAHDFEAILPTLAKTPDAGQRLLDALTFRDPTPPALARAVDEIEGREENPLTTDLWDRWKEILPRPS
ncbi:hypothetical protein [Nocardia sp. NBC_00416]|uniref:hypothetical protein n=1 Tax=Nocardia sp. NBC_00416 TaxID=2975991 RepID=UPI002E1EA7AF